MLSIGAEKNATLQKPYLYPEFVVTAIEQTETLARQNITLPTQPILAIAPGAEYGPSKRWPLEYFAEIAEKKLNEGWHIWLFGSAKDRVITDKIMALINHRALNLAGNLQLYETIHLLSIVTGILCNDSGIMHIAAALNKRLMALYGSTSPDFTPPLNLHAQIVQLQLNCQPCFKRECPLKHHQCMRDLKPERVIDGMNTWSQ